MSKENTRKEKIEEWERLIHQITKNVGELAYLEVTRARLEEMLAQARDASARQAAHRAGKQEASAQLKTLEVEGERLANWLRRAVKQNYGIRSEKLSEFGLKPFRGRNRKKSGPEIEPIPAAETGDAPEPAR